MASGIAIADKCLTAYSELSKRVHSAIVLKINESMTEVNVEKTITAVSGDPEAEWKQVLSEMPDDDCRYIITDFQAKETPTVTKSKIILILWSSEFAPVRNKMIYASSMEAVTTKMSVQKTVQATEKSEVEYKSIKDEVF